MKNLILLIGLLVLTIGKAQIVITANDMPFIGQEIEQGVDTLPGILIQPGGVGQGNWDFSGLYEHLTQILRVRPPAEAPLDELFPEVTAAMNFDSGYYQLIRVSPDKLQLLGLTGYFPALDSSLIPVAIPNQPAQTILHFPATFGQQFTETLRTVFQLPVGFPLDSIRLVSNKIRTIMLDGYGLVKTPAGEFNSIRMQEQVVSVDTTFGLTVTGWVVLDAQAIPDTNISYGWWGKINNRAFPLMELSMDRGAQSTRVVSATWVKNIGTSPIGEPVRPYLSFKIFPNPANSYLIVELQEGGSGRLQIFDFKGNLVLERNPIQGMERMEIGKLPKGNYMAILKSRDGKVVGGQRFEVQR